MQFRVDYGKKQARRAPQNCVLIGSKLEIRTWGYLRMVFTRKMVEQVKKKTSGLKKQTEKKADESQNRTRVH